jgi:hypothetical protein
MVRLVRGFPDYTVNEHGVVRNRKTGNEVTQTKRADHLGVRLRRTTNGTWASEWVHRLVAKAYLSNPRPDLFIEVDHIDGNEYNNHKSNLRWLNRQLNSLNSSSLGCVFNKKRKKWQAHLRVDGHLNYLGFFDTFLEGHRVYKTARDIAFNRIYTRLVSEGPTCLEFLP